MFNYVIEAPLSDTGIKKFVKNLFKKENEEKPSVIVNEEGFTFNLGNQKESLPFKKCKNIYATGVMYKSDKGYEAFYLMFFIELFNQSDLDINYYFNSSKGSLPFIVKSSEFTNYWGVCNLPGVYINLANGPEIDPIEFLKSKGFELKRHRPAMNLDSIEKYNEMIKEMAEESYYEEYKL